MQRACHADFVDDGQALTDEEWSDFFQTQLDNIRREAASEAEGLGNDDADADNPFHGLPDPFDEDLSMPGVGPCKPAVHRPLPCPFLQEQVLNHLCCVVSGATTAC